MTATATKDVQNILTQSLGLRNFGLIEKSPERSNIKYVCVRSRSKSFEEEFQWLIDDVKVKGNLTTRTILYCQSRKQVCSLYSVFCGELPEDCHHFFQMYHTNTESDVQQQIITNFSDEQGDIRVLFSTIAFGMGVDVRGVHTIILVGPPVDLDDFMQLSGRAGRDGKQSFAILLDYPGARVGRKISSNMKEFLKGAGCRREIIRMSFPCSSDVISIEAHNCCDICAPICCCQGDKQCNYQPGTAEKHILGIIQHGQSTSDKAEVPIHSHDVTNEQLGALQENLEHYRNSLLVGSSHLYTGSDMTCGLTMATIKDIVSECHIGFSFQQFCRRYFFSRQEIAKTVWDTVQGALSREGTTLNLDYSSSECSTENTDSDVYEGEYAEPVNSDSDDSD